jgi:predicted nucleotidyltransferase
MVEEGITKIINDYVRDVKDNIPDCKVYLFGSYAHGQPTVHSDIDIAVISDYFKGMRRMDAGLILYKLARKYKANFQPFAFTRKDVEENTFVRDEIIAKGREM